MEEAEVVVEVQAEAVLVEEQVEDENQDVTMDWSWPKWMPLKKTD